MFIFKLKSDDDLRVEKGDNMRRDDKKKGKNYFTYKQKLAQYIYKYKIIQKYEYSIKLK